jgi:hypothetical protein
MEGIHGRALQKGYKNLHRGPGKSVHTEAISDEKQSTESSVGNSWKQINRHRQAANIANKSSSDNSANGTMSTDLGKQYVAPKSGEGPYSYLC